MNAVLMLSDGTVFEGERFGAEGDYCGEVVFNTAMTGYQEILTDPSYKGQIVCLTYPLIGNYGVNEEDVESRGLHLSGLIVREYSRFYSNWRGAGSLEGLMQLHGIVGICEIDTRALTRRIRVHGAMTGIIASADKDRDELMARINSFPKMEGSNYVDDVTSVKSWKWASEARSEITSGISSNKLKNIVVIDYGTKFNILRSLAHRGCGVTVVPAEIDIDEILSHEPKGIVLSNGPGDPAALPHHVERVKGLLGKVPIFGICLGHQLLGAALGGKTFKLPFGHHGANHPVKNHLTGRVEITSQNHGFAIDPDSLPDDVKITHTSLYDGTVEGLRHEKYGVFSVQYHPEASPGPHDADYLFDEFMKSISG